MKENMKSMDKIKVKSKKDKNKNKKIKKLLIEQ
jgi:hypothetical protein